MAGERYAERERHAGKGEACREGEIKEGSTSFADIDASACVR